MNKELWKINESLKDVVAKLFGVKKGLIESDDLTRKSLFGVLKAIQTLKKKNRDGEIIKAIKDIPKTKFPKVQKVEVKNPVNKVEVDKPSWYKGFTLGKDIFDPLLGAIGSLANRVFSVGVENFPTNPKEWINVRLTNGKYFYGIGGAGGGGPKTVWLKNILEKQINPAILENQAIKDAMTGVDTSITYPHHEIHGGSSFVVCDVQSVDATTMKWQITTPDSAKLAHILFDIDSTGEMFVVVTEGSDRVDGTALVEINRNRDGTPAVATVIVTRTPTGGNTDGAVTILSKRSGATGVGNKTLTGGGARGNNEYILKPDTKYVVSITTYATVFVSFCVDWYEHTSQN